MQSGRRILSTTKKSTFESDLCRMSTGSKVTGDGHDLGMDMRNNHAPLLNGFQSLWESYRICFASLQLSGIRSERR